MSTNRRSISMVDWSIVAWSKVSDGNDPEDLPRFSREFLKDLSLPSGLDATLEIGNDPVEDFILNKT